MGGMRRLVVLAFAVGIGWSGHALASGGCGSLWYGQAGTYTDVAPPDVVPWMRAQCKYDADFDDCSLVALGHEVAVTAEWIGLEACQERPYPLGYDDIVGFSAIVTFVPDEPLRPGEVYTLVCGSGYDKRDHISFTVTAAPAAPPEPVEVTEARLVRGDDEGCCAKGDVIELEIANTKALYLRQGGRIEASYPNGQVFSIERSWYDGGIELPGTHEDIELTPVAANGVRGATIRLTRKDVTDTGVYLPCGIAGGGGPSAAWLLVPLWWIHRARRRRRA